MRRTRVATAVLALAVTLAVALPATADFEAGQQAWDAGRPDEALTQWRSAANDGDRRAMLALGRLYVQGLGVLQDYVEAHKWLNLAASRGEAAALEERDALAAKMTPAQMAAAQERAAAWRPGASEAGGAPDTAREQAAAAAPTTPPATPSAAGGGRLPPRVVREAQSLLGALGYRPGPADGIWGRRTAQAYRAFLRDAGLPAAETLTPEALHAMRTLAGRGNEAEATGAAPAAARVQGPPPEAIREAQALLAKLGHAPGPADGNWSEGTARAYREFLADAGLPAADTLTPAALRALRAVAEERPGQMEGSGSAPPSRRQESLSPDVLHRAAQAGDVEILKAALAAGVDVDARDGRGWTALMHAVDKGFTLFVPPLLEANAAVDVRAPDGATALFMAAVHGHTEIVATLMRAGADIWVQGPKGRTAVDVARARYGEPDAVREKGLDTAVLALVEGATWAQVEDDAAWARAEKVGTAKSYGEYASSNPRGRHVDKARRLQQKQERAERLARKWPRGTKLRDCDVCPEMVVIPAGKYRMGSPSHEAGRDDDEDPVHDVTIWEPLAVGVYEVTREEFGRFVKEAGYFPGKGCRVYRNGEWKDRSGNSWKKPGFKQRKRHPVVCVSWEDARAYVRWLSGKTEQQYRLLSESEWEYVARAGTETARYWGEGETGQCRHANGADRSGKRKYSGWANNIAGCDDGHVHTAPVGSYTKNAFGLHDVMGNVWEWVQDCWNSGYHGAPSDGSAWLSGDCARRVLRGGSCYVLPRGLRSANRYGSSAGSRYGNGGFRVARTLD